MSKPRVYIDTSCFVDAISYHFGEEIDEERTKDVDILRRIFKASENGDIEIFTSSITVAECRYPKKTPLTDETKRLIRSILSSGRVVILVEPTIFISEKARDLTWEHNIPKIKGADSIHLATALEYKCSEFLTVDAKIIKQNNLIDALGLQVIRPSETSSLPMSYREGELFDTQHESSRQDDFITILYKKRGKKDTQSKKKSDKNKV